jgi:hypothetical protein
MDAPIARVDYYDQVRPRFSNDWYIDPPEATEALLRVEAFSGLCLDPACGIGTIPKTMQAAGLTCVGTDIVDRGYVDPKQPTLPIDFLKTEALAWRPIANIVSNPPFNLARPFVDNALSIAGHKVAMLLPLTFLEGAARARWLETTPLARVHVFSWRISMPPGELLAAGKVKTTGGKKAFAWFVWERGWVGPAQTRFLFRPVAA